MYEKGGLYRSVGYLAIILVKLQNPPPIYLTYD